MFINYNLHSDYVYILYVFVLLQLKEDDKKRNEENMTNLNQIKSEYDRKIAVLKTNNEGVIKQLMEDHQNTINELELEYQHKKVPLYIYDNVYNIQKFTILIQYTLSYI